MTLADACDDLRAEARALRTLLDGRTRFDPHDVTPFFGWRVRDTVAHLAFIDRLALLTLTDPAAFAGELAQFAQGTAGAARSGAAVFARLTAYEDSRLSHLDWDGLLSAWDAGRDALIAAAGRCAEDAKVKWFGPDLRLASLLNARQMEVWAYGQDVFDLYRAERAEADRLRNVAEFAVRTFGFSFVNRGLAVPEQRPYVALTAPSDVVWTWNAVGASSTIAGSAVDFCRVATQRRHAADTDLEVRGDAAQTWMRIAQCIAGPPLDGPAQGSR